MRSKTISFTGAAELGDGSGEPLQERGPVDGLTGRTLGDFVVRDKMGEGGFGSVYRAEQPTLAREAVIKVVNAGLRGREDITGRFMREARLASKLDHPFAAHIYAFGAEPDGLLWIAMELVRGTPLDRVLEGQGPVPLQRLVPLVERICEVVHSAHEEGIIHRDLKPANVVVISRSGRLMPKLLDFGIAKLREDAFHAEAESAKDASPLSTHAGTQGDQLTPAPIPPVSAPVVQDTGGLGKTQVGKRQVPVPEHSLMDAPAGERFELALSMHLTQQGLFIGSPHYMPPEQWLDATSVDARTDNYAIAVLTYQCLTGKLPFDGDTLREVRDKHMVEPVPSLGPDFPPGLDAFFKKALAKAKESRYSDAMELAAALRAASGLAEEPVQLPRLDELVREMLIAEAPQPLAEAVAALESARNAQHALELTRATLRTVAQYLGTVALAGRVRQGSGAAGDAAKVLELLTKLRRASLTELEWLELTHALCLPFQGQRDVHPTPEFIAFFCEPGPSGATGGESLRELTGDVLRPDASEDEARTRLNEALPRMAAVLRELGPLFQYTLAFARAGRLEKWTGVRRTHRPTMRQSAEGADKLLLTDAEGTQVLTLSPLAQVMAPSPGAPEEVFFLEGDGRHGAKLRALPSGFERHDAEMWPWFREHVANVEAGASGTAEEERPPYLGLSSFSVADAKNFYGREQEAESFANRLRVSSLLAVVGPSGSGKSSFIQAGVLPLLPSDWRAVTVRPGPQPLAAVETRLGQLSVQAEGLREELKQRPEALGERLLQLVPGGGTLVLVVDQFEELITLCADADEREHYARALVRASDATNGRVKVIVTLRDDFLIRCQAVPSLRERLAQGLQLLGTPAREDLLRILIEPARHAGYEFESPELPAEMVQSVSEQPGALALLSFTATRLWELRDRQLKRLTRKAYQALGGVGGALAHHAEATLAAMSEPAQKLVREAFRHLVTAEGTRAVLPRRDMVQLLGGGAPADEVLESLIHARLLVASEGQGGEDRVEVIHEALLISWPRLVKWQREDAEHVRMRDQVRAAARQWEERKRDRGLLWRGEALMEYRLWRPRYSGGLTTSEEAFGASSLAEDLRGRRIRTGLMVFAFLLLAAGISVLYRANGRANASAAESKARLVQSYRDTGRRALAANDPNRALVYLQKARELGGASTALDFMIAEGLHTMGAERAQLLGHHGILMGAEYSPDGERVATAGMDGQAGLWKTQNGERLALLPHPAPVNEAHFSADGRHLFTLCKDGMLRTFDGHRGTLEQTQNVFTSGLRTGLVLPSGEGMVVGGMGGEMALLRGPTLEPVMLAAHTGMVRGIKLSANAERLVSWSLDGTAHVYRLQSSPLTASLERTVRTSLGRVIDGDLSPDGTLVALRGDASSVEIYEVSTGERRLTLRDSSVVNPSSVKFSPDGRLLVTASNDNAARIWDVHSGELVSTLPHDSSVRTVRFNADGSRLLTSTLNGDLRLWSMPSLRPLGIFGSNTNLLFFTVFAPDGKTFLTGGTEGTARLWETRHFEPRAEAKLPDEIIGLAMDREGQRLQASAMSGQLSTFALEEAGLQPKGERRVAAPVDAVAWSADRSFALISSGGALTSTNAATPFHYASPNQKKILGVELSPDQSLVAVAEEGGSSALLDAHSGAVVARLATKPRDARVARFSPDGKTLLVAGLDDVVQLWDVQTRRLLVQTREAHPNGFLWAAFSPDGRMFATAGMDRHAVVWSTSSGAALSTTADIPSELNYVSWSADGKLLGVGSSDGWARVVDPASGEVLAKLDKARTGMAVDVVTFTRTGGMLVGNDDGEIHLWELPQLRLTEGQLADYIRCQLPYTLDDGRLTQVTGPRLGCPTR